MLPQLHHTFTERIQHNKRIQMYFEMTIYYKLSGIINCQEIHRVCVYKE